MATTSQHSDFDRVKRWDKAFLGGAAGPGSGIGQGDRRPRQAVQSAPGGRPRPLDGWPPGGAVRAAPWVQDRPPVSPKAQDSLLAMAGGTAVVLGSLMPWISFDSAGAEVKPGAKAASVVLGLIVVALGFALRAAPLPGRLVAGIATLCLSSLALLYVGFILGGLGGVPEQDPFGDITTVTFAPNIGIILAAAGCGAAFIAAIMSFHHRQD